LTASVGGCCGWAASAPRPRCEWLISGQKGYKHIDHATLDEVNHFAAAMRSQAKLMDERAAKLLTNAHKKLAGNQN